MKPAKSLFKELCDIDLESLVPCDGYYLGLVGLVLLNLRSTRPTNSFREDTRVARSSCPFSPLSAADVWWVLPKLFSDFDFTRTYSNCYFVAVGVVKGTGLGPLCFKVEYSSFCCLLSWEIRFYLFLGEKTGAFSMIEWRFLAVRARCKRLFMSPSLPLSRVFWSHFCISPRPLVRFSFSYRLLLSRS